MSKIYVGVDWYKRTSTWVVIDENRQQIYCRSWGCTPEEVHTAISSLPASPVDISLGVEPVCGWRWMTQVCIERGIEHTYVANPKRLREIAQTAQKTDRNDAHTITELLRMDYLPVAYRAPDAVHSLRILVRQRGFFVRLTTATKCRIHGVCTALGAHVTTAYPMLVRGKTMIMNSNHEELKTLYTTVEVLEEQRHAIERKITACIEKTDTYRIISSILSVGPVTAAAILAEVGDFERFKTPSALVSYAGLYPRERSTGGKQQFGAMSKTGSKILRYSIVEASMRVRDWDKAHNLFSHYDVARNKRKKTPKQARVVLAHKMLTIMWHLAKRGVLYDDRAVKPAQREMTS
jgi:transposase